jgi:hypothetical protein
MKRIPVHTRLSFVRLAAATALGLLFGVMILAAPLAKAGPPQQYLALGDSIAFGFNPLLNPTNADNFIGYPTPAAAALNKTLTNASCPGETSSHFINLAAADHGCAFWRAYYPLHVKYATTQLVFADAFLQANPNTHLVSIDIGPNDLFVLRDGCGGVITCIEAGLPGVLATLSANLDTIYGHIRNLDGFKNKLVALTIYSLDYSDPVGTAITSLLNQVVEDRTRAWGGVVADGFTAFEVASLAFNGDTCAAGLRIVVSASPLTCDVHPSPAGRDLLAQAIVNALRVD